MKKEIKIWSVIAVVLIVLAVIAIYIFTVKNKAMTSEEIDSAVEKFKSIDLQDANIKKLGAEYLTYGVGEYLNIIGENTVEVNVLKEEIKTVGLRIAIMPVPDVLNNEFYYYNKYGDLMLYKVDSLGVGGSIKYYFSKGKIIERENNLQEEIDVEFESEKEILDRADKIYNMFK